MGDPTMKMKSLLLLSIIACACADAPAASDLSKMVAEINSGKFQNNFFEGHMLTQAGTVDQQVGGCLLDKDGAIVREHGIQNFQNDLKVDLAAFAPRATVRSASRNFPRPTLR